MILKAHDNDDSVLITNDRGHFPSSEDTMNAMIHIIAVIFMVTLVVLSVTLYHIDFYCGVLATHGWNWNTKKTNKFSICSTETNEYFIFLLHELF